ncbi:MAG TPA: alpha-ketoglutarate-dependent dioxygenase AlkB [Albitalea sp.]|nr:alpha-ketoglutarate-dependent dioxygenase AlkB [Albitalea sp.]
MTAQAELFEPATPPLPEGMRYCEDLIDAHEEAQLLEAIAAMPLAEARYKQYTARRRVLSFGSAYDDSDRGAPEALPLPDLLIPLRARLAAWAGVPAEAFAEALVAEYRPGTPLGWHRDMPAYDIVAGVSLGHAARMRLRRYPPVDVKRSEVSTLVLAPRSAYVLQGVARWGWQHSIAPTEALRHSITFRTRRQVV